MAKKQFDENLTIRFKAKFKPIDEQKRLISTSFQYSFKYMQDLYIINNYISCCYESSISRKYINLSKIWNNMLINPILYLIIKCSNLTQSLNNLLNNNSIYTLTFLENSLTSYQIHNYLKLLELYFDKQDAIKIFEK